MKIIVTGSLGNISKPLAEELVKKGNSVTVISSDPAKQGVIKALGATPSIGSLEDPDFLTTSFSGADAAYCMIPFNMQEPDQTGYFNRICNNYLQAIRQAGVQRVVVLSGWAAEMTEGENPESVFHELKNVHLSFLRPSIFYSNFYSLMDLVKGKGMMGSLMALRAYGLLGFLTGKRGVLASNYGGADKIVMVSPRDIAAAAAEELESTQTGKKVRYVGSDEMTCNEAARILGTAVGKPYLKWITLTKKQMQQGLKMAGFPETLAARLADMQEAIHNGTILAKYNKNKPILGKVKLKDFAREFAAAYAQKQ